MISDQASAVIRDLASAPISDQASDRTPGGDVISVTSIGGVM